MSDKPEPSPRPWRIADPFDDGFPVIRDANERQVATLDGETPDLNAADAALIVDAVNNADSWRSAYIKAQTERNAFLLERDRLRDALKRIAGYEDGIVGCIESGHASGIDWDGITFAMIQEARAAIGEDAP